MQLSLQHVTSQSSKTTNTAITLTHTGEYKYDMKILVHTAGRFTVEVQDSPA